MTTVSSEAIKRALVFGVSGMTWRVAEPLLRAGRLPNLQRLVEQGCSGDLMSVRAAGDEHYRPQIAWATLATGCLPEHHGLDRFYHTADDCKLPGFWKAFEDRGLKVGLFGWPMTWPPRQTNGFLIPCYHGRDDDTWPPELRSIKWLERQRHEASMGRDHHGSMGLGTAADVAASLWRNGVRLRSAPTLLGSGARLLARRDPQLRSLLLRETKSQVSVEMFLHLYRRYRPHLATFHTFLVDYISHRYWRYHEPQAFGEPDSPQARRLAKAVERAYIFTDQMLGRIVQRLAPDTIVAVVSEHGMAPEPISAEVGDWQYLIRGNAVAQLVGLGEELDVCPIARWIAYRPKTGRGMPPQAAQKFAAIRVVETGLPLFSVWEHGLNEVIVKFSINRDDAIYAKGQLDQLHVEFEGKQINFTDIARRGSRQRSAMHEQRGVLVIAGPGIRRGAKLPESSIIDFAPTLLRAVGLSADGPFDGHALDLA